MAKRPPLKPETSIALDEFAVRALQWLDMNLRGKVDDPTMELLSEGMERLLQSTKANLAQSETFIDKLHPAVGGAIRRIKAA